MVLRPGASAAAVARRHGLAVGERFRAVFNGFGAAGAGTLDALASDPDVTGVVTNEAFHLGDDVPHLAPVPTPSPTLAPGSPPAPAPAQVVSAAATRIGLLESPTAGIDGQGPGVDADIAIVDTGIDPGHPDLEVAGGYNCTDSDRGAWADEHGHGTAVAGVAAMKDNDIGLVGVAPGARLWAVRVFDADGQGTLETVLCGLEWVALHADVIDVANMSFAGGGSQDNACGAHDGDVLHRAVCAAARRGVTLVAAAGNESADAADEAPAGYPDVITVSALGDSDGLPGGLGGRSPCDRHQSDDHLASFSNHGAAVDIAAPGVCVDSAAPLFLCEGSPACYVTLSGTSLAAPLVTGAAALLAARHPDWAPVEVRAFLVASAEPGPLPGDEADPYHEGVLNVVGY